MRAFLIVATSLVTLLAQSAQRVTGARISNDARRSPGESAISWRILQELPTEQWNPRIRITSAVRHAGQLAGSIR